MYNAPYMPHIILEEFEESVAASEEKPSRLERLSARLLTALFFLLPVFFIPGISFPISGGKTTLFLLVVLVAFALFVLARLKSGRFVLPSAPALYALGAVALCFIVSALFSGAPLLSFAGQGFEVGTALGVLISSLAVFLCAVLFRSKEQIGSAYLAFLGAFFLLVFFHLLRLIFGSDVLSFGLLTDPTANTVGKWNDLAIFFGASALLSVVTLEFLALNRLFRFLLWGALFVSLFFLVVINFSVVWYTLGVFALVFLVYRISFQLEATTAIRRLSFPPLLVLLLSVIFMLAGGTIGNRLSGVFGINNVEARPSWSATFEVAKHTLVLRPLFGAGPNRFANEWLKWKPAGINETVFWNTDFENGVGLIPSFLATIGIVGMLAWLLFFLFFLYAGFRALLAETMDLFSRYIVTSSFFVALFFWVFSLFYIPSPSIFALSFLFTGLFVAALQAVGEASSRTIAFGSNPRSGFVSVLLLILFLIGSIALGYFVAERYLASVYFQKGVIAFNRDGNLANAETAIMRAAAIAPLDLHFRALADLTLVRMNALLQKDQKTTSAEAVRTEFQGLLGTALSVARQALSLDQSQYQNLLGLGRVYEAVVPLKIAGAYESARASYEQALVLNPQSPAIELTLARLEVAKGDHTAAREHIQKALTLKNNYLEAIFLLSSLQVEDGDLKAAIQSAEAASFIAPSDPTVLFQLGILRFNDKNYAGAAAAFERAVLQNPSYANAKYFLALSYEKLGRTADALRQFADLAATNPDNTAITNAVKNLKAGRASSAAVPEGKPERRTLPVPEKSTTKKGSVGFEE